MVKSSRRKDKNVSKHGGEKGHNILSIVEIKEACRGADKGEVGERGTGQT